nr:MAG TPA: hypothetical protein [Bacteriophage sp.]
MFIEAITSPFLMVRGFLCFICNKKHYNKIELI